MIRSILIFLCLCPLTSSIAQNQIPQISNLNATLQGGSEMLITYDLMDNESDDVEIIFRVSDNNGETFDVNTDLATGDLGYPISPGMGKSIVWNYESAIQVEGSYQIMLVADDQITIDIQEIVDQVDSVSLRADLEMIEGVRHRTAGATHLQAVKDLIVNRFNANQLETEITAWSRGNYTAENILGRKAGLLDEQSIYIIDGHFDSVDDSPGADDNGSAVAGMLEALRVLAPYEFEKTIRFIGFDLEEEGLIGSQYYTNVDGLKDYETVEGVINLEMIGYYDNSPNSQQFPTGFNILYPEVYNANAQDSFRGNFITNVGIHNHPELNQAFEDAASQYVPELKVASILAPENWLLLTPDLGRSDHAPFWLQGMPALMITDGSNFRNPFYHSPADTVGTLNFTFMSNVVKATVATIAELAGVTHSSSMSTDINVTTSTSGLKKCVVELSPNPNQNAFHLNLTQCLSQPNALEIYSASGELVETKNIAPGITSMSIATNTWAPGIYLLIMKNDHEIRQEKIVVSR